MIVQRHASRHSLRLLDLGTGSACIPLALAHMLDESATIEAIDISPEALTIAEANIRELGKDITLRKGDILTLELSPPEQPYDIIVSNPPYIHPSEAELMDKHVLEHEPSCALFAPHSNPIIFYEAIARMCYAGWLALGGHIYVEINPMFAERTLSRMCTLLSERTKAAEIIHDLSGKARFIHIQTH